MAKPAPAAIVIGAVTGAVARVADRDDNPVPAEMVPAVSRAILDEVAKDPAVRHATNAEPWYTSRVTWGALIAGAAPLLGIVLGHDLSADEQSTLIEIGAAAGTLLGAGLALYGRWVAKTPIGTPK